MSPFQPAAEPHLRKGETYTDLAAGFEIGTTTVFRCIREALDVLAARAPTLHQAIDVAAGTAFVILDGTLLATDRVAPNQELDDAPSTRRRCTTSAVGPSSTRSAWSSAATSVSAFSRNSTTGAALVIFPVATNQQLTR